MSEKLVACRHTTTMGRRGESGSWCQACGIKVYEVETRECLGCAHFFKSAAGYSGCRKHLMAVSPSMLTTFKIKDGTCWEAAISASPAGVGGWIPVGERLPEAGKGVLAYYKNSHGYGRIVRAFYAPKHALEANSYDDDGQFDYDEATDTAYLPEGWLEKIDNWGDFSSIYIVEGEVTHWQPLPAAPAATKKEKEE